MDAALLRNTFSRLFYQHAQVSISFKEYRHVAKYMANELNISFQQFDADDDSEGEENEETGGNLGTNWETAQTQQFGHSTMTEHVVRLVVR